MRCKLIDHYCKYYYLFANCYKNTIRSFIYMNIVYLIIYYQINVNLFFCIKIFKILFKITFIDFILFLIQIHIRSGTHKTLKS